MAWIRLSDNYMRDEKVQALTDGAFRLWHEGLAYCRQQQTDGLISFPVMRNFVSFTKGREKQLASPLREGMDPLWELIPRLGYKVHNYLVWNPSKDEENERRAESRDRMRGLRERRVQKGVAPPPRSSEVRANSAQTSLDVLERRGEGSGSLSEKGSGEKPVAALVDDALGDRARELIEHYRDEWYPKYRHGARLRLLVNAVTFGDACDLCRTWDDPRLEKLARIVLTTDESFIAGTDRSFKIFAMKASWADDRLSEIEHGRAS
jgi:hypothetical protein